MRVILLTTLVTLMSLSCGPVSLGRGAVVSQHVQPPANAVLIYQGVIQTADPDVTLSGTAQIYRTDAGACILRITGLSSSSAFYFAFVETSASTTYYITQLSFTSGSRNYATGSTALGQVFSRVVFRRTASLTDIEIASAALLPVM